MAIILLVNRKNKIVVFNLALYIIQKFVGLPESGIGDTQYCYQHNQCNQDGSGQFLHIEFCCNKGMRNPELVGRHIATRARAQASACARCRPKPVIIASFIYIAITII